MHNIESYNTKNLKLLQTDESNPTDMHSPCFQSLKKITYYFESIAVGLFL